MLSIAVWFSLTDRNIDGRVVLELWILPQAVVSLAKCYARDTASDQAWEMLIVIIRRGAYGDEHVSTGSKQPKKSVFHGAAPVGRGSLKIAGFETTSLTRLIQSVASSGWTAGGGAWEAILLDMRREEKRSDQVVMVLKSLDV